MKYRSQSPTSLQHEVAVKQILTDYPSSEDVNQNGKEDLGGIKEQKKPGG